MPDNIKFADDSERLAKITRKYTKEGKQKSRLIKLTSRSKQALEKAVAKRLEKKIVYNSKDQVALEREYARVHSELAKELKVTEDEGKDTIEHLSDKFDYLAALGVELISVDRKLKTLNDRLAIKGKKTFNLKGMTFKNIVSNISKYKNSFLDKYTDKRIANKAFETAKEEIDKFVSEGNYSSAEQTLMKFSDYKEMAPFSAGSGLGKMNSNTGDVKSQGVTANPETNPVSNSSDDLDVSTVVNDVSAVEVLPIEEIDKKFVADRVVPASFQEITSDGKAKESEVKSSSELTEEQTSVGKYGIDFTKFLKKEPEQTDKKEEDEFADVSDVDFDTLVRELGSDQEKGDAGAVKPSLDELASLTEKKSESISPEVVTEEDLSKKRAAVDSLAKELGIELPFTDTEKEEVVVEKFSVGDEASSSEIKSESGTVLENEAVVVPKVNLDDIISKFETLDKFDKEMNDYKTEVAHSFDRVKEETQASLSQIAKQSDEKLSAIYSEMPIVTPSPRPEVTKAPVDSIEEELKAKEKVISDRDAEIEYLKGIIASLRGEKLEDSTVVETAGKKI